MGLYQRNDSRFWWMSYTAENGRTFESTKTSNKEIATKILKHREGEIALGLFKVGLPGTRVTFAQLCEEFLASHSSTLSIKTQQNHRMFINNLKPHLGEYALTAISRQMIENYRNQRRSQAARRGKQSDSKPTVTVKGATVNRELACLQCMFEFAITNKYITENPAAGVKRYNENRERPAKRMLTPEAERRILDAAPPYLRVGVILLVQTGARTYSEGLWLRWDQVDLDNLVIHLSGEVKNEGSQQPLPLTRLAADVLLKWKKQQGSKSPFVFPSPQDPERPIGSVKCAWKTTLKNAGVPYFPIYNLRHVFCTRLSWVAPDAVVQHAMRHSSPETKRRYQLGIAGQVRTHLEQVNKTTYTKGLPVRLSDISRKKSEQRQLLKEASEKQPVTFS
ncbi:MAG TPA: site-specific integrase [Candidatus Angelobacter sp.]